MGFKYVLPIIYIYIEEQTQLEVNWTEIDHLELQKLPYLKMPFWPSVNHQNPYSSYIFNEFVWNFHNLCKYGFRE